MKNYLKFIICVCVITVPHIFSLGLNSIATAQSRNRPDLNGLLIRNPVNGAIYLVDEGKKRPIVNLVVYNRLFVTNHRDYLETVAVQDGSPITNDNRLLLCKEDGHPLKGGVYFLDLGKKRLITSPEAMNRYNLNWNGISNIDCPALAAIPTGSPIYNK